MALSIVDHYDTPDVSVGIRSKPPVASTGARASTRLTENFFFVEINLDAPCRAVSHRPQHTVGNFRNQGSDLEVAFHSRLESSYFFGSRGVLQIVKCSAVGNRGNQCSQLERSHGNAFAEGAHFANAA